MPRFLLYGLATTVLSVPAFAVTPQTLTWQARLLDGLGTPLTGTHDVEVLLYDASGTARWAETHAGVAVEDGFVSLVLGSSIPFDPTLFDDGGLELEIRVDGTTLGPRVGLHATPFARTAENVRGGSVDATDVTASGELRDATGPVAPPGMIVAYAGATPPPGWLLADGSAVSRTTYARLFAAIATTYGAGDGATTFNLPDLRGIFPRGAGTNGQVAGQSAVLGQYQDDALADHTHYGGKKAVMYETGGQWTVNDRSFDMLVGSDCWNCGVASPVVLEPAVSPGSATVSAETRPANVGVNYLIKY